MSKADQSRILVHFSRCKDPRTRPVNYPIQKDYISRFLKHALRRRGMGSDGRMSKR